jgi:hypothetical protein
VLPESAERVLFLAIRQWQGLKSLRENSSSPSYGRERERNCRSRGYPGFPVEFDGVD